MLASLMAHWEVSSLRGRMWRDMSIVASCVWACSSRSRRERVWSPARRRGPRDLYGLNCSTWIEGGGNL